MIGVIFIPVTACHDPTGNDLSVCFAATSPVAGEASTAVLRSRLPSSLFALLYSGAGAEGGREVEVVRNKEKHMNSPILNAITEHNKKGRSAFHMPAHKGGAECLAPLAEALKLDVTEIPDTGSLFDGEGATAEAEILAAKLFGTAGTFMSAGGCTLCIQAMLRLAAPEGGKIICGRVIHRSASNAMALLGLDPVWVLPDSSAGEAFAGRITAQGVAQALKENPDAKAVYITTPDYFGVMSDIAALSKEAEKYGVPVLVDNAHGAHLKFIDNSLSPLTRGAAISADSAHKTLPVLTGGAWLNIAGEKFLSGARAALSLFGSTSPSYLIMLSLDLCRAWLSEDGSNELKKLAAEVIQIKKHMADRGFILPQGECDPLRIAFNPEPFGLSGAKAGEFLRQNRVESEYTGIGGVILIPSPFNTQKDFEQLQSALSKLPGILEKSKKLVFAKVPRELPQVIMSPRQALTAEKMIIPSAKSAGRTAGYVICPCPPAIPIVMPGEMITAEAADLLTEYGILNINVVK